MLIKVCGMRDSRNIDEVAALQVDMMGFIFYHKSPRCITDIPQNMPTRQKKTGVFVNEEYERIIAIAQMYGLDYIQLHGNESRDLCKKISAHGLGVIKAFQIASAEDLVQTARYEDVCDYFLFDTKCESYGGSGKSFDWSVLSAYKGATPFLLSGGIRPSSLDSIVAFRHEKMAGIDLNSGFETAPAMKDAALLNDFITRYKSGIKQNI